MDQRFQLGILDQLASQSGQISHSTKRLQKIDGWLDWQPLYKIGRRIDKTGPKGGQPRKPVRRLILQYLYQLSDPQLEDYLIDRLSFRRFVGLPLDQSVPDFTTFWRFREALAGQGLVKEHFSEINRQLQAKGLFLKQRTVVDATIIESTNRPLSDKKREKLESTPSSQIDSDADSTKKGGRYYFGYKGHIEGDIGSKLIRKICFTPASPHDSTVLEELISEDERSLFGDIAYGRESLKQIAREHGCYYGILGKGKREDPLSDSQTKHNKPHQRVRDQVEHPFSAIKDLYGMRWAQVKTKVRNEAKFIMAVICWNIERSITWSQKPRGIIPAGAI